MKIHNSIINLKKVKDQLKFFNKKTNIIAISKTFGVNEIIPLLEYGHIHFGENKIQEALKKWIILKEKFPQIKLHMVGGVQTNKAKYLLPLFDYIHSLDSIKLAEKIATEEINKKKKVKIFIQVNIGNEPQKKGISICQLDNFYQKCIKDFNLDIIGLMCLPPKNRDSKEYFNLMKDLVNKINLNELSMGMSGDYLEAIKYGSTFVRIGSIIFGNRY